MLKTTPSIVFALITFTCMAQGMAGVECTIKNMEDTDCKWYIYNKHNRPVEFLLKKTTYYGCHEGDNRPPASFEFIRTLSPGQEYELYKSREYCMVCDKNSYPVDVSVITKNFVGNEPNPYMAVPQLPTPVTTAKSSDNEDILKVFMEQTGQPVNNKPTPQKTVSKPNNKNLNSDNILFAGYEYGTLLYYDKTKTAEDVWNELKKSYWRDMPEMNPYFEPYIEEMRMELENASVHGFGNLIEKAYADFKKGKPNTQKPTNPTASPTTQPNTENTTNSSSSNTPAPVVKHYNENFVLFWISSDLFQENIKIQFNGSYLVSDNKPKQISGGSYSIPDCDSQERCLSGNKGLYCGNVLRAILTQTQNSWAAYEVNGGRKWSGSFTAKPGCNIIEIK